MKRLPLVSSILMIAVCCVTNSYAQTDNTQQDAYKKTLTERSSKIVNTLDITDSSKYKKIVAILTDQYFQINQIDKNNESSVAAIKAQNLSKEEADAQLKQQDQRKATALTQLHTTFITSLQNNLTPEQVEKVKDGITYRVLPITYTAYQDMILTLTTEQKEKIYTYLVEARELAMDEGSSDRKHAMFGKYKGKINNYLSALGYDMKKEEDGWRERIKAKKVSQN